VTTTVSGTIDDLVTDETVCEEVADGLSPPRLPEAVTITVPGNVSDGAPDVCDPDASEPVPDSPEAVTTIVARSESVAIEGMDIE